MVDEEIASQTGLTLSGERGLTTRSSRLARRGLELVAPTTEAVPRCCVDEVNDAVLAQLRGDRPTILHLFRKKITDACLVHVARLTVLEALDLGRTQVTDAGLRHLTGLSALKWLDCGATQVTDAGLLHLAGLRRLEELCLKGTRVADSGLACLQGLTCLKKLDLSGTRVTDAGLVHLHGLTGLQELCLPFKISDARLPDLVGRLQQLPSLRQLSFPGSDEGPLDSEEEERWAVLRRALPECRLLVSLL